MKRSFGTRVKSSKISQLIYLVLLLGVISACSDVCTDVRSYIYYEPIYTSLEEVRAGIKNNPVEHEIKNPGKIYYLNGNVLINQPGEGIHVINNANPANPQYRTFIEIPGNFDIAGTGNYLFVDSYIDLVVLDVSNFENISEVKRIEDYFPSYNNFGFYVDPNLGVVSGWKEVEHINEIETDCYGGGYYEPWIYYRGGIMMDAAVSMEGNFTVGPGNTPGIGGSLAKFTLSNNYLYTIDNSNLTAVDVSSPTTPILQSKINLGWGIETIFPYEDKLFVGSNTGMSIYSIETPSNPTLLSTYSHVLSCDPVAVQGDYAYVTLRDGTTCMRGQNVLEVIDISDPTQPQLVKSYNMYHPQGLGVDGSTLFVCDGVAGLKIFNIDDKMTILDHLLKVYPELQPIDVIPFNGILMLIATDGLYQYDYSDIENITLISTITLTIES